MTDILDALMRIQYEFRKCDLEPPAMIALKDHEQGMRLLAQLHLMTRFVITSGSGREGKIVEHPDGSVWMEAEVYGMKVHWPAVKYATEDGGYVWM